MAVLRDVAFTATDWTVKNTPERMKVFRKYTHRSQTELAAFLGVAPATVCRWENGHHVPDFRTRRSIQNFIEAAERLEAKK